MGDHEAEDTTALEAFLDYLAQRLKAVAAAAGILAAGAATALVTDPRTAAAIETVLPEQFRFAIPIVLGIAGVALVEQVRNRKPAPAPANEETPARFDGTVSDEDPEYAAELEADGIDGGR